MTVESWSPRDYFHAGLAQSDPEVADAIAGEWTRQRDQIELIASENFVSRAVLDAQGSWMTNKTVEGYPTKRYYGGAEHADRIEQLAITRAKALFGCQHANVQPHCGSAANQAVYLALLQHGDTILSMDIAAGGHISHGHPATFTGKAYRIVSYGVSRESEQIDFDQVARLAKEHHPKLIIAGGSAYPRAIDFARFRAIADDVGARLLVDMAHFAGLVACGLHPNPFPHADVVTTTTYKSLRGARGAMVLTDSDTIAKKVATGVFPGVQGSVMLHAIAGKAACLSEAQAAEFKLYNEAVIRNAQSMADALSGAGVRIVTGGTDTGLLLVDLRGLKLTGAEAVDMLEHAGLTCNKNVIPFDPQPPEVASGLRLSSNAGSTRGFGASDFSCIGGWIAEVLHALAAGKPKVTATAIRERVRELCVDFPFYDTPSTPGAHG